jgi:hypothetical protein
VAVVLMFILLLSSPPPLLKSFFLVIVAGGGAGKVKNLHILKQNICNGSLKKSIVSKFIPSYKVYTLQSLHLMFFM